MLSSPLPSGQRCSCCVEELTGEDIFHEISTILDPEKPMFSLGDLDVVAVDRCRVEYHHPAGGCHGDATEAMVAVPLPFTSSGEFRMRRPKPRATVHVTLRPTVPHCHLMALICLSVRAKLLDMLPLTTDWKVVINLVDGSHMDQTSLEKQINDKERVSAALENPHVGKEIRKLVNPYEDST